MFKSGVRHSVTTQKGNGSIGSMESTSQREEHCEPSYAYSRTCKTSYNCSLYLIVSDVLRVMINQWTKIKV